MPMETASFAKDEGLAPAASWQRLRPSPSITFGFEANSTNNPAIDLSVLSSANDMSYLPSGWHMEPTAT